MTNESRNIAVIFDFDETLTQDSTSQFLSANGIDTESFWTDHKEWVNEGWDPTLAFLQKFLNLVGEDNQLGELTNEDLREFGSTLDFYPGIPDLFDELRNTVGEFESLGPRIEFYIVSSGLSEIIRGSSISNYFKQIWGCEFGSNNNEVVNSIKRSISFTEKTRYIFEINKGIVPEGFVEEEDLNNPYLVNKDVDDEKRRVPIKNMIYLGDGQTDIPCFSLIEDNGGQTFAVCDPNREDAPENAHKRLLNPGRVSNIFTPDYQEDSLLGEFLRLSVENICSEMETRHRSPYSNPD